MRFNKQKIIKEAVSIFFIFIGVFAFRSTFYEPYTIPSGSMIPTLKIGDYILVDKWSYGFKIPFSEGFPGIDPTKEWKPIYITSFKSPKRGDVVVFKYPKDKSINYIKRVVGLPGDELEIIDNIVYINGKSYDNVKIPGDQIMKDMDFKFKHYEFDFYQSKTGDHTHVIQLSKRSFPSNRAKIVIPPDKYFMMGDNRDFSADSRYWGFVSKEEILGKALFIWFSMVSPFSDSPFQFRFGRIGTKIDNL